MNRIVIATFAALIAVVGWSLTAEETQAAGHGCHGRSGWNFPVARGVYRVLGFERRQARRSARREVRHHGCSGHASSCHAAADCSGHAAATPPAVSHVAAAPHCACPGGVCPIN